MLLGALEAGGTKMVCSVGNETGHILKQISFATTVPDETLPLLIQFFSDQQISALGIGSFGPLDLMSGSLTYGSITETPKAGWSGCPILKVLSEALKIPALIDTDVNAAALAERQLGAGQGKDNVLYVTIGTGIGGGIISMGQLVHGLVHPEFGHMLLQPYPGDPMPDGVCPFHAGCLEGLASGSSIRARFGLSAQTLPENHPAWELETEYLSQMCVNATLCMSPEIIILGGGVMQQTHLFRRVRTRVQVLLNNYVAHPLIKEHIDDYIVPPGLGANSGVVGALLLAAKAVGC
jgi:fructokinase